ESRLRNFPAGYRCLEPVIEGVAFQEARMVANLIGEGIRVFRCPNCKEFINTTLQQCRFCGAAVDPVAAEAAAVVQSKVNAVCNVDSDVRGHGHRHPQRFHKVVSFASARLWPKSSAGLGIHDFQTGGSRTAPTNRAKTLSAA